MRWIAIFLLTASTVWAKERLQFLDIPIGRMPKEIEIPTASWFPGILVFAEAVVVGEVQEVTSQVMVSAAQVLPEETCTLRIDSMFGTMPELAGATMLKLHAQYIHDTYQQLEPDWGVYGHLKHGQRVMALIDRYEGRPAIGSEALILLTEETQTLPEILKRTQMDPTRFTDSDFAVLRKANLRMCEDMADRAKFMREKGEEEIKKSLAVSLKWPAIAAAVIILLTATGFILRKRKV